VKRISKNSAPSTTKRSPKLPDELHPIVDAVVEIVFERLRSVATAQNTGKIPPVRRKTAKLNLPLPKQRTALAEEIADLLLTDLANGARGKKSKAGKTRAKAGSKARPPSRRGYAPPKARRARLK